MPGRPRRLTTADEARLRAALAALLRDRHATLEEALSTAARGAAAERVHRSRVVARGLRSIVGTLDGAIDARIAESLREDLRVLGHALGPVREADVRRDWLLGLAGEAGLPPRLLQPLTAVLDRQCAAARKAFRRRAGMPEFRARRQRIAAALSGRTLVARPQEGLRPLLARRLRRRWKRVLAALAAADGDADALHAIRLRAKHARYATEALLPLLDGDPGPLVKPLKRLQGALGDHRDGLDARSWLASLGEPLGPALLARLEEPIRARLRKRWREYRRLRRAAAMPKAMKGLGKAADRA
jgi:CHAD domain-containing protein